MKRFSLIIAAATVLAVALVPSLAAAAVIELGVNSTGSPIASPLPCTTTGTGANATTTCPNNTSPVNYLIILTRATALETVRDGNSYPTTVKQAGSIVAFTVGLSLLDTNPKAQRADLVYLDGKFHGRPQVQISVLAPVGPRGQFGWKVVAVSPVVFVRQYLGEVVQIPLAASIPVQPGDVIALTTPTWAPVLTISLNPKKFAYRQSRRLNCDLPPGISQAQATIGQFAQYKCDYAGTRAEYSATEITAPIPYNKLPH
jgi:hypothetical protein